MSFLAPAFLTSKIGLISLILGAVVLVILSDFMNKHFVFPVSDALRATTQESLRKKTQYKFIVKYLSEALATVVFITYCWLGSVILATFVFEPILGRLRNMLLIVVLVIFFAISYLINSKSLRGRLMKV